MDKLIELYEQRPCLWNVEHEDYHNRQKRSLAISEIEKEMGMEKDDIVQKWITLRGQYLRELEKQRKSRSGQSTAELYVSGWKFYKTSRLSSPKGKTI